MKQVCIFRMSYSQGVRDWGLPSTHRILSWVASDAITARHARIGGPLCV